MDATFGVDDAKRRVSRHARRPQMMPAIGALGTSLVDQVVWIIAQNAGPGADQLAGEQFLAFTQTFIIQIGGSPVDPQPPHAQLVTLIR